MTQKILKVLLVDDETTFVFLGRKVIEKSGLYAEVLSAVNGEEALEVVAANTPDIVFLDLHMPIMNGFEFLTELKARGHSGAQPYIAVLSSSVDPADVNRAENLGANTFIVKPLTEERLKYVVAKAVAVDAP